MSHKIAVLIVEDSPVIQMLLTHILDSDEDLKVVGSVASGEDALIFLKIHRPDVIVMDVNMPGIDGFETTRRIMETRPIPIVICSANLGSVEATATFKSIEAGALAVIRKPTGPGSRDYEPLSRELVATVKSMSEVKLVRRWAKARHPAPATSDDGNNGAVDSKRRIDVVAIGASTGGPPALEAILSALPKDFPSPILIVQHITAGFLPGLVDWLTQSTGFPVRIAVNGESMAPGCAYLAPDGTHMGMGTHRQIVLSRQEPENGLRPSVAYLFRSVAAACGANAAAVLLTGMGKDGAVELKLIRDLGGLTIAQDSESSVVHGMPGEAIQLGAANYVLPPHRIASTIVRMTRSKDSYCPL